MTILKYMQHPSFMQGKSVFFNMLNCSLSKDDVYEHLTDEHSSIEKVTQVCALVIYNFFQECKLDNENLDYSQANYNSLVTIYRGQFNDMIDVVYLHPEGFKLLPIILPFVLPIASRIAEEIEYADLEESDYWPDQLMDVMGLVNISSDGNYETGNFYFDERCEVFNQFRKGFFTWKPCLIKHFAYSVSCICSRETQQSRIRLDADSAINQFASAYYQFVFDQTAVLVADLCSLMTGHFSADQPNERSNRILQSFGLTDQNDISEQVRNITEFFGALDLPSFDQSANESLRLAGENKQVLQSV